MYSIETIDNLNVGNVSIPNESKYQNLIDFLRSKEKSGSRNYNTKYVVPDRQSFGHKKVVPSSLCIFTKSETLDDEIKCQINELNSKISEHNVEEILNKFKLLKFGDVTDVPVVSASLHSSILICCKYGDHILELFEYLVKQHPQYSMSLKNCFQNFTLNKLKVLNSTGDHTDEDLELKFTIKRLLTSNYELMIKCFKMGILFDDNFIPETVNFLTELNDEESMEILIRFYINLRGNGIKYVLDVNKLDKLIKSRQYSKRLVFLLMDLE